MAKEKINPGDIFCIPLFLEGVSGRKHQRQKYDETESFSFGRFIEDRQGSGLLIEVFNLSASIKDTGVSEIVSADRLFAPVMISGMEFSKNRWRVLFEDDNYNRDEHSNYSDIHLVQGAMDDLRLKNLSTNEERRISKEEAENYEIWRIWDPMSIENRIRQELEK